MHDAEYRTTRRRYRTGRKMSEDGCASIWVNTCVCGRAGPLPMRSNNVHGNDAARDLNSPTQTRTNRQNCFHARLPHTFKKAVFRPERRYTRGQPHRPACACARIHAYMRTSKWAGQFFHAGAEQPGGSVCCYPATRCPQQGSVRSQGHVEQREAFARSNDAGENQKNKRGAQPE